MSPLECQGATHQGMTIGQRFARVIPVPHFDMVPVIASDALNGLGHVEQGDVW